MYRVEWLQSALDDLANIWNLADSAFRQQITQGSHRVEQQLRRDPHQAGESRSKGRRIVFEPPLAMVFKVEEDDQTVSILEVRCFRSRRP